MQRDTHSSCRKFAPAFFFRHDFQAEHLSVIFAHLFHPPSKQNHARQFHCGASLFQIQFCAELDAAEPAPTFPARAFFPSAITFSISSAERGRRCVSKIYPVGVMRTSSSM